MARNREESSNLPKLTIAPEVTRAHGETFAEKWFQAACNDVAMVDALAATSLLVWPAEDDEPAQDRYETIEEEILRRTFAEARPALAEAFTRVASEVLARERQR
jgi:hypothetical protein